MVIIYYRKKNDGLRAKFQVISGAELMMPRCSTFPGVLSYSQLFHDKVTFSINYWTLRILAYFWAFWLALLFDFSHYNYKKQPYTVYVLCIVFCRLTICHILICKCYQELLNSQQGKYNHLKYCNFISVFFLKSVKLNGEMEDDSLSCSHSSDKSCPSSTVYRRQGVFFKIGKFK